MTILLVSLVFLNFLLVVLGSRLLVSQTLFYVILVSMVGLLLSLGFSVSNLIQGTSSLTFLGTWITSGLFDLQWTFSVDALTFVMLFVVLSVSFLVHLYSMDYMKEDPHLPRFISYLSLFSFFMLILVSSDSFVSLFLGWEGVGLCSYLLIGFWYTRVAANKAAIKAMIVNRVADLALTVGILALFYYYQSINFSTVFSLIAYGSTGLISFTTFSFATSSLIASLLFLGAMGKSAQLGLHTWLPDAMEGPTPVSALIHAATMVTAGVFLIVRSSVIFESAPQVLLIITLVGAMTAFMAATSALLQNDLKKIIAYSTCSQLGYMIFACGLSNYALSIFHLTNHAFFKALLFLSAGAVIHGFSNEQDLRQYGKLLKIIPYTYIMITIGSLALMGFPFLTGFYSKDIILEVALGGASFSSSFSYALGLTTAFFTAFYSYKLIYLTFYGESQSFRTYLAKAHELTARMSLVLGALALGSIFLGYGLKDLFVGFGTSFWNGTISLPPAGLTCQLSGEFLHACLKLQPFFGSLVVVGLVFSFYEDFLFVASTYALVPGYQQLYRFFSHKWYFDLVYNRFVNQPLLEGSYSVIFSLVDKGLLEYVGPTSSGHYSFRLGFWLTQRQSGRVYDYAFFMLVSLYVFILVFNLRVLNF